MSCFQYRIAAAMALFATGQVQGIQIPNSGHWGPDFVIKMLDNFFAGNSTKTSK